MYPKLVRDNAPDLIRGEGKLPVTQTASDEEYWDLLQKRLSESVEEFLQNNTEEKIADILEVIDAICDFKNVNRKELQTIKEEKAAREGRYGKRVVLDGIEEVTEIKNI